MPEGMFSDVVGLFALLNEASLSSKCPQSIFDHLDISNRCSCNRDLFTFPDNSDAVVRNTITAMLLLEIR